jgi:predicted transcriptional regulator
LNEYLATVRQRLIERAMKRSDGNRTKAGNLLGVSPQAMSQYLRNRE